MCRTYIQHVGFILSDTVTLIPLVFPFLLTKIGHEESILLILFHFSENMSYPCKCIHKIARFVICNYVNGEEVVFD